MMRFFFLTALTALCCLASLAATSKPVFFHYMVIGVNKDHITADIKAAQALGVDAFALNMGEISWWSNATVENAFEVAKEQGFKVFFSFDLSAGIISNPSGFQDYYKEFVDHPAHFKYDGKPLVTTFGGSYVTNDEWQSFKDSLDTDVVLVPSLPDISPSEDMYSSRSAVDGLFNWNSWPYPDEGRCNISTAEDSTYMSVSGKNSKLFMMGMSPMQYKHMSADWNWYRRAEGNLENRVGQVLQLQPDMLELQTWNDAGEGHYMGYVWPESSPPDVVNGYSHTGYWEVLAPFIQAWKRGDTTTDTMAPTNGKVAQGAFWHHTLLKDADCSADPLGQVGDHDLVQDLVTGIIMVQANTTTDNTMGLTAVAYSGGDEIGYKKLSPGFNAFIFEGLQTGNVTVEVWDHHDNMYVSGTGPLEVVDSSDVCNFNFQVVPLS